MALRRRSKFQIRLFVPMVLLAWFIIGVLFVYQYHHEREYRTDIIHDQLSTVSNSIISAYERDISANRYLEFIRTYFSNSIFDDLMVSVYDKDDRLIYAIGTVIPLDVSAEDFEWDLKRAGDTGKGKFVQDGREGLFYFTQTKSNDGQITVMTAMPLTADISSALGLDGEIWFIVIGLTVIVTVVVFFSTRFLTRNILLLRDFALRAAKGEKFDNIEEQFSNDEVGEISRQIVQLYKDKAKAVEKGNREHKIALHAVEEKSRVKRQLTNNINHELKTPIGVIRGYIETILSDPKMDEGMRTHFLTRTHDNVERLCSLMNDVSTITRLDENGQNIPLGEVDMHDLVFGIDDDLRGSGMLGEKTFEFDIPLGCKVRANEGLLSGLIMNLIRNANLHSHGTEIGLKLIAESSRFYIFAFYDNGNGVGEEHIPHLFERFYRVDSGRSRKAGGTGLGLPIVKSTIVSFGGSISVHNRSTGGLEFVFTIPKWDGVTSSVTAKKISNAKNPKTE